MKESDSVLRVDFPALRVIIVSLICGVLLFVSIDRFVDFGPEYNSNLADLFIIVGSGISLWHLADGDWFNVNPRAIILLSSIALSFLLSTWLSEFQSVAWDRLKLYYGCALFGLFLFARCGDNTKRLIVPVLLAISSVHILYFSELIFSVYDQPAKVALPVTSLHYFGSIRHFGILGFLAASSAAGLFLLNERFRATGYLFCFLSLYGILQFGARGALLAWFLFVASILWIVSERKQFFLECVAVLLLAASAVLLVNTIYPMPDPNFVSIFERHAQGEAIFSSDSGRLHIWQQSLAKIAQRPWFGYGPDGYLYSRCCSVNTIQPHNAIIQGLFEFGFSGVLLCLVALIFFFKVPVLMLRRSIADGDPDREILVLTSLLGAFLAFSLVDGLLYHGVPLMHFTILMSILGALTYRGPPERKR